MTVMENTTNSLDSLSSQNSSITTFDLIYTLPSYSSIQQDTVIHQSQGTIVSQQITTTANKKQITTKIDNSTHLHKT